MAGHSTQTRDFFVGSYKSVGLKQLVAGELYKFHYANAENDFAPLVIIMSWKDRYKPPNSVMQKCKTAYRGNWYTAINLHYLPKTQRIKFLDTVRKKFKKDIDRETILGNLSGSRLYWRKAQGLLSFKPTLLGIRRYFSSEMKNIEWIPRPLWEKAIKDSLNITYISKTILAKINNAMGASTTKERTTLTSKAKKMLRSLEAKKKKVSTKTGLAIRKKKLFCDRRKRKPAKKKVKK